MHIVFYWGHSFCIFNVEICDLSGGTLSKNLTACLLLFVSLWLWYGKCPPSFVPGGSSCLLDVLLGTKYQRIINKVTRYSSCSHEVYSWVTFVVKWVLVWFAVWLLGKVLWLVLNLCCWGVFSLQPCLRIWHDDM